MGEETLSDVEARLVQILLVAFGWSDCCILHILINIVVEQVIRPTTVFPQRELEFFKSIYYLPGKSVGARTSCCASPVCHLLSGALFSNESAPAFHLRLQKPMNSDHHFLHCSKSHWELHFSYGFDMTSSCYNTCGLTKFWKLHHVQFRLIFSTCFNSFVLALFGVASWKLQTIQQTCLNMLRFRPLMSPKPHCA